jgi:serine/threonine-protein kinase
MSASSSRIVADKYALGRMLGQGAMGAVWSAEHLLLRSQVAVKFIDPGIATDPEASARFLREARSAAALRSPHVVQILDYGIDNGAPFIVMELLEGESLGERLHRAGPIEPRIVADLLTQVARAVSKAHDAGIVHRDLKPHNIFIVQNDDVDLVKVLDFGIAKMTGAGVEASLAGTRTGTLMGTPLYMSPEQAEGTKQVDFRADLWSLGVIAFECIVGRRPFETETIGSLILDICSRPLPVPSQMGRVPPGFDAWFARACAREPAGRFASAKEQMQALRRVCGHETASAHPGEDGPKSSLLADGSRGGASSQLVGTTRPLSTTPLGFAEREPRRSRTPFVLGVFAVIGFGVAAFMVWQRSVLEERHAASSAAIDQGLTTSVATASPSAPVVVTEPFAAPPVSAAPSASSARDIAGLAQARSSASEGMGAMTRPEPQNTLGVRTGVQTRAPDVNPPDLARSAQKRPAVNVPAPSAAPAPTGTVNLGI